ncbi:MAG: twin-arginine translocation signal domain-containing protein [Terracidiphilus sp.]
MKLRSRRDFLKTATASAAVLAAASRIPASAAGFAPVTPVKVWGTFRDQRHAELPGL